MLSMLTVDDVNSQGYAASKLNAEYVGMVWDFNKWHVVAAFMYLHDAERWFKDQPALATRVWSRNGTLYFVKAR